MERKEYWTEVRSLAEAIREDALDRWIRGDDWTEALYEATWEHVDGHQWIIYTGYHFGVLDSSENSGYWIENFGPDGIVEGGELDTGKLAFGALYGDVCDRVSQEPPSIAEALGLSLDYLGDYGEDADDQETREALAAVRRVKRAAGAERNEDVVSACMSIEEAPKDPNEDELRTVAAFARKATESGAAS